MPTIRPSADLRNKYNEISQFCHDTQEAVFITKNGAGDLAVLDIKAYEVLVGKAELRAMLQKSLGEAKRGEGKPVDEVFDALKRGLTGSDEV